MIIIAFFFLLRPGENTYAPSGTTPFTLGDVQLAIGDMRLPLDNATDAKLVGLRIAKIAKRQSDNDGKSVHLCEQLVLGGTDTS